MKKKTVAATCVLGAAILGAAFFTGCGADFDAGFMSPAFVYDNAAQGNYGYESVKEQDFQNVSASPAAYFSLDRNTAGYSFVRAQINAGETVAGDSVRVEEMINYFSYGYPAPAKGEGMRATAYLSPCPWEPSHKLVTVGVRTEEAEITAEYNNYVLLVDVSGSMSARVAGLEGTTRMDLVKYGAQKLTEGLGENDYLSVVTYASGIETVLAPTAATEDGKDKINRAIASLRAYGSTNGEGGLQRAYGEAAKHYSQTGNNRVILMTDGDFNVGISDTSRMKEFIQEKAKSGIYLSVLGFGLGNTRDDMMQTLALNGNGNYACIDTPQEAQKVLCEELGGMLTVVAKDAKAKIEFNAESVEKYRLIGYDMKLLSEEEFENSKTDAGEIGSNLCVTALFEVELSQNAAEGETVAQVTVRFKTPGEEEDGEAAAEVKNTATENGDTCFISCVAELGLILRRSQYGGAASFEAILSRLSDWRDYLAQDVYKAEFEALVQKARESGFYGERA